MQFILVNGRSPRPQSFCTLCCEPIQDGYVREIATHHGQDRTTISSLPISTCFSIVISLPASA